MFDIHPPHAIHNWRDFLTQIFTITVGLLIALALEGCVEWLHHRHVMHQAQDSLYIEIKTNAGKMQDTLERLHSEQKALQQDVVSLKKIIAHPDSPAPDSLDISFSIKTFQSVSWKTAQATGALAYMPYEAAQQYSDIYGEQASVEVAELQAARDATTSMAPLIDYVDGDPLLTREEAASMKHDIEVLQGQLLLVDRYLQNMDLQYKNFLAQQR